jgi:hypothetical protein
MAPCRHREPFHALAEGEAIRCPVSVPVPDCFVARRTMELLATTVMVTSHRLNHGNGTKSPGFGITNQSGKSAGFVAGTFINQPNGNRCET